MCFHVKGRFPVKCVANLIKCVDSWARLQFSFLSESLRATLSRRNNRSRAGPKTLIKFRRNGNRQWIPPYSTFIHAISLSPEMFTRLRQDTNDSLFVLRPWCNAIRVHTLPPQRCIEKTISCVCFRSLKECLVVFVYRFKFLLCHAYVGDRNTGCCGLLNKLSSPK